MVCMLILRSGWPSSQDLAFHRCPWITMATVWKWCLFCEQPTRNIWLCTKPYQASRLPTNTLHACRHSTSWFKTGTFTWVGGTDLSASKTSFWFALEMPWLKRSGTFNWSGGLLLLQLWRDFLSHLSATSMLCFRRFEVNIDNTCLTNIGLLGERYHQWVSWIWCFPLSSLSIWSQKMTSRGFNGGGVVSSLSMVGKGKGAQGSLSPIPLSPHFLGQEFQCIAILPDPELDTSWSRRARFPTSTEVQFMM